MSVTPNNIPAKKPRQTQQFRAVLITPDEWNDITAAPQSAGIIRKTNPFRPAPPPELVALVTCEPVTARVPKHWADALEDVAEPLPKCTLVGTAIISFSHIVDQKPREGESPESFAGRPSLSFFSIEVVETLKPTNKSGLITREQNPLVFAYVPSTADLDAARARIAAKNPKASKALKGGK